MPVFNGSAEMRGLSTNSSPTQKKSCPSSALTEWTHANRPRIHMMIHKLSNNISFSRLNGEQSLSRPGEDVALTDCEYGEYRSKNSWSFQVGFTNPTAFWKFCSFDTACSKTAPKTHGRIATMQWLVFPTDQQAVRLMLEFPHEWEYTSFAVEKKLCEELKSALGVSSIFEPRSRSLQTSPVTIPTAPNLEGWLTPHRICSGNFALKHWPKSRGFYWPEESEADCAPSIGD